MGRRRAWCASLLVMLLLTACADEDAQIPPPAAPTYVQNTTYNNNVTYAYNTTTETTAIMPLSISDAAPSIAPDAPTSATPVEAAPPSVKLPRNPIVNGTTRDLRSTGIVACDEYLDRVESCSRQLLPQNVEADRGFSRIQMSLDMSRRAWRHAAENKAERAELARTCSDARAMYESSIEDKCN